MGMMEEKTSLVSTVSHPLCQGLSLGRVGGALRQKALTLLGKRVVPLWAKGLYHFRQKVLTPLGKGGVPL